MLVLTRKKNESIVIDGRIEIEVLQLKTGGVRIGIKAPRDVAIMRGELLARNAPRGEAATEVMETSVPMNPRDSSTRADRKTEKLLKPPVKPKTRAERPTRPTQVNGRQDQLSFAQERPSRTRIALLSSNNIARWAAIDPADDIDSQLDAAQLDLAPASETQFHSPMTLKYEKPGVQTDRLSDTTAHFSGEAAPADNAASVGDSANLLGNVSEVNGNSPHSNSQAAGIFAESPTADVEQEVLNSLTPEDESGTTAVGDSGLREKSLSPFPRNDRERRQLPIEESNRLATREETSPNTISLERQPCFNSTEFLRQPK